MPTADGTVFSACQPKVGVHHAPRSGNDWWSERVRSMRGWTCGCGVMALAIMLLVAGPLTAADAEKRFAVKGVGAAKCSAFIKSFDSRATEDIALFAGWISGFISALNEGIDNTFDLAPWQSPEVLVLLMRDLCGKKPEEPYYRAAAGLVSILGRDRLQTLSEPVEIKVKDNRTILPKDIVKRVQERLKALDLYKGTIDGAFGPGMQKALEAFQKQQKIAETGIPDQQTLLRLFYQTAKP
jgi:hypothetical protein